MRTYLFLGDSVTDSSRNWDEEGLGEGYVRKIAETLHYGSGELRVVNAGTDGYTLEDLLSEWEKTERTIKEAPGGASSCFVSVLIGINDALGIASSAERSADPADFTSEKEGRTERVRDLPSGGAADRAVCRFSERFRELAARIRAAGCGRVTVLEPFALEPVTFGGAEAPECLLPVLDRIASAEEKAASEAGFVFVPTRSVFLRQSQCSGEPLTVDGIHPTDEGHELLAERFLKTIRFSGTDRRQGGFILPPYE